MKNNGFKKILISRFPKITNFVVLVAICFCVMSCDLNANGEGENNGGSGTVEPKILTGACGETAETEGVEVLPLNGKQYYFKEENYYMYPDYAPQEFKDRIQDEELFREVVADRWNEWIVGTWNGGRIFTEGGEYIYNGKRGGKYEINTDGAYYYYENDLENEKEILLSVIPETKYYFSILDSRSLPVCVEDGVASLQAYNEYVSKGYQL